MSIPAHMKAQVKGKLYGLLLLLSFFILKAAMSQDSIYAYKVKGNDSFRNSGQWQKIKEGEKLLENTWIKIEAGGEVTLIKPNGFKTIKGRNISQVKDINFDKNDATWERLYAGLYNILNTQVHKGATVITKGDDYKMLFPADGEVLMKTSVHFRWRENTEARHYFLLTEFPFRDSIHYKNDNITTDSITLPDKNICPGLKTFDESKTYLWSVTKPGNTQGNFIRFSFAGMETIESFFLDLGTLVGSKEEIDPQLYLLLEAVCYDNYHFYSEANTLYELALKAYPDSVLIRDAYRQFILKIEGLNT